jgi:hypothetical protein
VLEALRTIAIAIGLVATPANVERVFTDLPEQTPPAMSPSRFRRACREGRIPGARRSGRRWLVCESDFFASLAAAPAPKLRTRPLAGNRASAAKRATTPSASDDARELLARAGVALGAKERRG